MSSISPLAHIAIVRRGVLTQAACLRCGSFVCAARDIKLVAFAAQQHHCVKQRPPQTATVQASSKAS